MSNQIAVSNIQSRLPMPSGMNEMDSRKWRVLCESVFPNAKSVEAVVMAVDYCKARNLDIMKRPVNIVPMWNKALGREVETIWPSINEVQVTAARTGKYAGMDEPKWGKEITRKFEGEYNGKDDNGNWQNRKIEAEITYPQSCSVTVYRMVDGQRCAFTEPVFWEEAYSRRGKTNVPNDMWAKRPRGQILKVAKAFSLRAAFPEEGEYTAEEMEGKEFDAAPVMKDVTPPREATAKLSDPMPTHEDLEALKQRARDAAAGGNEALSEWLKDLGKEDKKKLVPFGEEIRTIANEVDGATEQGEAA